MSDRLEIGPRCFASKATARQYVRDIMRSYSIGMPVTGAEHVAVLDAILCRKLDARDKIGSGVANYFVREANQIDNDAAVDDRLLVIRHVDALEPDVVFDYTESLDGDARVLQVHDALRAVSDEVGELWKSKHFAPGTNAYDQHGEPLDDSTEVEVRYGAPSWDKLAYDFAQSEGGWEAIETSFDEDSPHPRRKLAEEAVRERWIDYWWRYGDPILHRKS